MITAETLPHEGLRPVRGAAVLVVDDEPTIGEVLARYLQRAGFDTRVALDGPSAIALSAERRPDLVVLDIMLPGIDGLEVMRRLHELHSPRPAVILLTAKGEESDRIMGLRRGADDYVVKPFSPGELVARVQAVLRRNSIETDDDARPLELEGLRIDPAARTVRAAGAAVTLTQREFDLLLFLARHPGQVFSRDQLMELVWQFAFYTDTSTVTVHIRRLRAKIEPEPDRPRFIQTVWGLGYRFQA
ncbi:MAG TPA: response regulator transcription factor [Solirubrobacteraceae bacterium]|jgi:DNA-binding response OmpR family regulator